jgi:hypothetical protein
MKKRRNNRLIALMLTMILLFSSITGNIFALELVDSELSEQTNTPNQASISQDASLSGSSAEETAEPQIVEEDVSKRGKFEKHYLCSDGSYMAVVYPEQVNYYDGGEWKEVDNTLTLSTETDGDPHGEVIGLGNVNGKNSISSVLTSSNIVRSIQHELTHNLGGRHCDEDTPSEKCVLKAGPNDTSQWCSICSAAIMNN